MRILLSSTVFAACAAGPVLAQETFKLTCYSQAYTYDCDISPDGRFVVYDLDDLVSLFPHKEQEEIIRINTDARPRALQVALLVPILAGLLGLFNSFRMMRLPDPTPSDSSEGMAFG